MPGLLQEKLSQLDARRNRPEPASVIDEQPNLPKENPDQDKYSRVVSAGIAILYDDKTHSKIMGMLRNQKKEPAKALANGTRVVMGQMPEMPANVESQATAEILSLVAELANESGIFEVTQEIISAGVNELLKGQRGSVKRRGGGEARANQGQQQETAQQPQEQPQGQQPGPIGQVLGGNSGV